EALRVNLKKREFRTPGGAQVSEGDTIAIDGTTGEVFAGDVAVVPRVVVEALLADSSKSGEHSKPSEDEQLVDAVLRIMAHADKTRRMGVRANADTPEDARRARDFGAQ